jgi:hypothetical protein
MKMIREYGRLPGSSSTAARSQFERPDPEQYGKRTFSAQFGSRLQNLFPPVTDSSAPEPVRHLLQRIHEILPGSSGPEAK